jgi:hypothetical protein
MACSSISTRLVAASAIAPPLPPSPKITATVGTVNSNSVSIDWAIASLMPRDSDSTPGSAAGVSTSVSTGRRNFSARRNMRIALR